MPSTAKTVGKKSETDFFRSRLLINFENTKIKIADENSLTFLKNYDMYEELNAYVIKNNITLVDFINLAIEIMKNNTGTH